MEKKKIKLKTRLLISVILGTLALIIGFCGSWSERSGDTPQKIMETEQVIEKLCNNIGKKVEDFNEIKPIRHDDLSTLSDEELLELRARAIVEEKQWKDLEKIAESLVYENGKIAKAKLLTYCRTNPIPKSSWDNYLLNDRYEVSNREWKIQTFGSRVLVGSGIAVLSCVGTAIGIFLILTIIPWLWYFLLGRIIELSRAIQGK